MAGMPIAAKGVADRLLGWLGVPETSPFRSDRLWGVALALISVYAASRGVEAGPLIDQFTQSVEGAFTGANSVLTQVALLLTAFGVGRSGSSTRKF